MTPRNRPVLLVAATLALFAARPVPASGAGAPAGRADGAADDSTACRALRDSLGLAAPAPRDTSTEGGVHPDVVDTTLLYLGDEVDVRPTQVPEPDRLLPPRADGEVRLRFVIDARGRAEPRTIAVLSTTTPAFADYGRKLVAARRFTPGERAGHRVRVCVTLPITVHHS